MVAPLLHRRSRHAFACSYANVKCVFAIVLCALVFGLARPAVASEPQVVETRLHSELLSNFFKGDEGIVASVLLPDDYYKQPQRRFPTMYFIHAFNDTHVVDNEKMMRWQNAQRHNHLECIIVFLDANLGGGHHAFADSQNYGPWGSALVTEFIPQTDKHFRTIADASARFVAGHSSGGWSALWLQITHPEVFGGVWSISPDPVDFHDFSGPDLTQSPPGNFFHDARGNAYTIQRFHGKDSMQLQELATRISWGMAQFRSFEEVFSPRGADGNAQELFNRDTGVINPEVAAYWESHWDIDRLLADRWPTIGPRLRGKIHVFVGTDDTFHLDGPVHRMHDVLEKLDAQAQITFVPGADHWTVFDYDNDLISEIIREAGASQL